MDERREIERDEEPVVERHRTTIIETGGDRGGRGGGTLVAVLLLVVLAVAAFLLFGRSLMNGGDTDVNVDIKAPDIDLPKVDPPSTPGSAPTK